MNPRLFFWAPGGALRGSPGFLGVREQIGGRLRRSQRLPINRVARSQRGSHLQLRDLPRRIALQRRDLEMRFRPLRIRAARQLQRRHRVLRQQPARTVGRKALALRVQLRQQRIDSGVVQILLDEVAIRIQRLPVHRRRFKLPGLQIRLRLRCQLRRVHIESIARRLILFPGVLHVVDVGAHLAAIFRLRRHHLQLGPAAQAFPGQLTGRKRRADFHPRCIHVDGRKQVAESIFDLIRHAARIVVEQQPRDRAQQIARQRHIRRPRRQRRGPAIGQRLRKRMRAILLLIREQHHDRSARPWSDRSCPAVLRVRNGSAPVA